MPSLKGAVGLILSGRFWLTLIKLFLLGIMLVMILLQIPELLYDTLENRPVRIGSSADLDPRLLKGTSFAIIQGSPNFEDGFDYIRYGIRFTYFTVDPYGTRIIARAYDVDTEVWEKMTELRGKLRPFSSQPFSYVIRELFAEKIGEEPADNTFFLGVNDVPKANGWQIGTVIFAILLFTAMVYFFFFFRRDKQRKFFSDPLGYLNKEEKS